MLSMKSRKQGGIAILVPEGYEELALKTYNLLAANIFGITSRGENKTIEAPVQDKKSLQDIKATIETARKPRLNAPKLMTKQAIAEKVYTLTRQIEEDFSISRRALWHKIYVGVEEVTDIVIDDIPVSSKYSYNRSASKYNKIIEMGYGFKLLEVVTKVFNEYSEV